MPQLGEVLGMLCVPTCLSLHMLSSVMYGAAPIPLTALYKTADIVVLGKVESAAPVPLYDVRSDLPPLDAVQFSPVHLCELALRVDVSLKPQVDEPNTERLIKFLSYLPSPKCEGGYDMDSQIEAPALWMLRRERGDLRTVVDNRTTYRTVQMFSQSLAEGIRNIRDPLVATTYLFLKPGVVIPINGYSRSPLPAEVIGIGGWFKFLSAYRDVYRESNPAMRSQISLVVASFGHCLDAARQAAKANGQLAEWVSLRPFLSEEISRREEDINLAMMSGSTKIELLAHFESPDAARDQLVSWACSSFSRTKARARELLVKYFAIDPSALPCIPCELNPKIERDYLR